MDILGIGPLELIFILIILLLVVKPDDFSNIARSAGKFLNKMYRSDEWHTITRASRDLRNLPNKLAREAQLEELHDLKKELDETRQDIEATVKEVKDGISSSQNQIEKEIQNAQNKTKPMIEGQMNSAAAETSPTNETDAENK